MFVCIQNDDCELMTVAHYTSVHVCVCVHAQAHRVIVTVELHCVCLEGTHFVEQVGLVFGLN